MIAASYAAWAHRQSVKNAMISIASRPEAVVPVETERAGAVGPRRSGLVVVASRAADPRRC
jgi:hypothetical protein